MKGAALQIKVGDTIYNPCKIRKKLLYNNGIQIWQNSLVEGQSRHGNGTFATITSDALKTLMISQRHHMELSKKISFDPFDGSDIIRELFILDPKIFIDAIHKGYIIPQLLYGFDDITIGCSMLNGFEDRLTTYDVVTNMICDLVIQINLSMNFELICYDGIEPSIYFKTDAQNMAQEALEAIRINFVNTLVCALDKYFDQSCEKVSLAEEFFHIMRLIFDCKNTPHAAANAKKWISDWRDALKICYSTSDIRFRDSALNIAKGSFQVLRPQRFTEDIYEDAIEVIKSHHDEIVNKKGAK